MTSDYGPIRRYRSEPKKKAVFAGWSGAPIEAYPAFALGGQDSRRFKATSTKSIRLCSRNGLSRNPMAPASSAIAFVFSLASAETNIMGVRLPLAIRCCCNSAPLRPGMCISTIKQDESRTRSDCRKSSADANRDTPYPIETISRLVASRKDLSSSTIDIIGALGDLVGVFLIKRQRRDGSYSDVVCLDRHK